ncbi:MAG: hypothetical protein ACHBN1_30865 [Heteroscytonema crispum UTEX LB 1556]
MGIGGWGDGETRGTRGTRGTSQTAVGCGRLLTFNNKQLPTTNYPSRLAVATSEQLAVSVWVPPNCGGGTMHGSREWSATAVLGSPQVPQLAWKPPLGRAASPPHCEPTTNYQLPTTNYQSPTNS